MEKGHEDWLCVGVKRGPVWRGIPKEIVSLIQVPESRPDSRRSRRVRRGIPKEIVSQILPESRHDVPGINGLLDSELTSCQIARSFEKRYSASRRRKVGWFAPSPLCFYNEDFERD